ncbi:hypothetical protein FRC09_004979 [Ceratobasidium sp. 395]|nr:hypothetical protein FRC09_004979 [Ceratobasidium sp. 395]
MFVATFTQLIRKSGRAFVPQATTHLVGSDWELVDAEKDLNHTVDELAAFVLAANSASEAAEPLTGVFVPDCEFESEDHIQSLGNQVERELNNRFRAIIPFGLDTINNFSNNVSELKQLAARDYEDLLQCSIPVFDGLLPAEISKNTPRLHFVMAYWHSLAKLRLTPTLQWQLSK